MWRNIILVISCFFCCYLSIPVVLLEGAVEKEKYSQTASYIRAIGPTLRKALAKIGRVLVAPPAEIFSLST